MTLRAALHRIVAGEDLNFLLTNRIPRLAFTRAMGRISKVTNPIVARPALRSSQVGRSWPVPVGWSPGSSTCATGVVARSSSTPA